MTPRESLLFLSPIVPAVSGNGLAMRAAAMVQALARRFDVTLVIVPIADPWTTTVSARITEACCSVRIHPIARRYRLAARFSSLPDEVALASPGLVRDVASQVGDIEFDHVHVFRLYMAPFAEPWLERRAGRYTVSHMDLDDIESRTRYALARLHEQRGDARQARRTLRGARHYARLEVQLLPRFDTVHVCSYPDRVHLHDEHVLNDVRVFPNTVESMTPQPRVAADGSFRLLFLGNLHYLPNLDAAEQLLGKILPSLHRDEPGRFLLQVVGSGAERLRRRYAHLPFVEWCGYIENIDRAYATADVMVAPLRAGGGTRIKLLESFAFGLPVVASTIAAEGLGARTGKELLIADASREFVSGCRQLARDGDLAQLLAANASALLHRRYSSSVLDALVDRLPSRHDVVRDR